LYHASSATGKSDRTEGGCVVDEGTDGAAITTASPTVASAPLLEIRDVEFSYGHLQVLFGVSLAVADGECVALLGTNGAGKSTLLGVISGLLIPSSGTVTFQGQDITNVPAERRVELGMVQVRGGKAMFPSLSVEENLRLGTYHAWNDKDRYRRRLDEVVSLFPALKPLLPRPAGVLSGGEQQMVAIGRALMMEPTLLMIDELSLGLAPVVMQEILSKVEEVSRSGTTMLLVEQSLNIALDIATRACFMERGQIMFDGPSGALLERTDLLRSVFLGDEKHQGDELASDVAERA
jgi:branched-chain amino acid transport system ATP-binding protein